MDKRQVKTIIKLLKSKEIEHREALKQVFEQGGYLWACDGYVALEIGEAKDELKGKCFPLDTLKAWNATHTKATDIIASDLAKDIDGSVPSMTTLLHKEYKPSEDIKVNIKLLSLACEFLGVEKITLEKNENCYLVKPLESMDVLSEAMGIKAYVMGLN